MNNEEIVAGVQSGQTDLLEALYLKNKGLLAKEAKRYIWGGELEDLKQVAYLGLYDAAKSYKPDEGAAFSTYAVACIRQALQRYTDRNTAVIIPSNRQIEIRQMHKLTGAIEIRIGRPPTDRELCALMGYDMDKLQSLKAATMKPASLSAPISREDDDLTLADTIEAPDNTEAALDKVEREELHDALMEEIGKLPEEQQTALKERYWHRRSLTEMGKEGKKHHDKALRELRRPRHTKKLEQFTSEIYGRALQGVGSRHFLETWTSATERTALEALQNYI